MDLDFDSPAAHGLRHYVRLVAAELGLTGDSSLVQLEPPANAYLALDDRLARFPGRDLALIWDEEHGWALAVETHSGEDLIVQRRLGGDVLPPPRVVGQFARSSQDHALSGLPTLPVLRNSDDRDDLEARLVDYLPDLTTTAGTAGRRAVWPP
nr:DUF6292 family protein [Kibdelosporangium sp. MJ126-NF4]CEL12986.1 hypothetical protein [Kibdelosporangium sp. MJ126-NF4]CTQ98672.1 hypothetical protein [Kibdelosporangium sp. MJ126-NF4]